jgi:hypothetical protein
MGVVKLITKSDDAFSGALADLGLDLLVIFYLMYLQLFQKL